MKKTIIVTLLASLMLSGCAENNVTSSTNVPEHIDFKWISPTGNVAVSFYDQGENENWTTSVAEMIRPQLLANAYDAIVFDGVAGLTVLGANPNANYVFADWISEGTFYLVSTKHTSADAFDSSYTIDAFVQGGNASKAFRSLTGSWGWELGEGAVTYEDGAPTVLANIIGADAYDYYVLAEPAITNAKAKLAAAGKTLNIVYNLQEEWAKYHDGAKIPAGGLFINKKVYSDDRYKFWMDDFIAQVHARLDTAIENPAKVKEALDEYEAINPDSATDTATRFGITGALVYNLETNGNKLGLLKSGTIKDNKAFADSFATLTGGKEFSESLFYTK